MTFLSILLDKMKVSKWLEFAPNVKLQKMKLILIRGPLKVGNIITVGANHALL
jgi:hypothetical protein